MTNISKTKTDSKDYQIVHAELSKLISKLSKKNSHFFIDELLTKTEQVMLVKRFGAVFMFNNNYKPYRVSQTLGLSVPTTARIYENFNNDQYNNLLKVISKQENSSFLALINDLIAAQASPRARARLMNRVSK